MPTVTYNSSTGSDTAASGAGPATAVTGTAAAHTGGVASTTITLTNTPDLSGVAADDVLYLGTASGTRHLSAITAVDNTAKTVTVEDSFTIASGSAVNYAIGGKRASFNSDTGRYDDEDWNDGWTIVLDNGSTFTLDSEGITVRFGTGTAPLTITASDPTDPSTLPILDTTVDINRGGASLYGHIGGGGFRTWALIDGIKFTRSSGTWTGTMGVYLEGSWVVRRCRIEGGSGFNDGISATTNGHYVLSDNYIDLSASAQTTTGIDCTNGRPHSIMQFNTVIGCDVGLKGGGSSFTSHVFKRNTIVDCTVGIDADGVPDGGFFLILGNTIDQCTTGIDANDTSVDDDTGVNIQENIISNATTAISCPPNQPYSLYANYNHFYNNTTDYDVASSFGRGDDTSGDPGYTDNTTKATYDFTPANTPPLNSGPVGPTGT